MSKKRFKIIAFKCIAPEQTVAEEMHYAQLMRRSLKLDVWYKFFSKVEINDKDNTVRLPSDFFNDGVLYDTSSMRVSVSAIVGENGSGKSSILDMMLRVLNNAAVALLGEEPQYFAAEHVHYIEHVYGCLLFIQDDNLRRLNVKGRTVEIVNYRRMDEDGLYQPDRTDIWLDCNWDNEDELLKRQQTNTVKKLSDLFYTVVCNYSIYAYNPSDYIDEFTNEKRIKKIRPKQNYEQYPYLRCWLTGLFHKNDGYQMPLVLNPMRLNGIINAPKENNLAKERLLSMLFYTDNNNPTHKHPFRIINRDHIIVGFTLNPRHDEKDGVWTKDWMVHNKMFGKRSRLYKDLDEIGKQILNYLKDKGFNTNGNGKSSGRRYLVYKIIRIGLNYKKYQKILSNLRHKNRNIDLLHRHIDELLADRSHITVKLRRTLMYLKTGMYSEKGTYFLKDVEDEANRQKNIIGDYELADFLPPPIFDIKFIIVKTDDPNEDNVYEKNQVVPFENLSSGERQIAYIISNLVYHLVNINSVHTTGQEVVAGMPQLKYKYINVVFDEIELYFHPDLQRRFLSLIISALRNIHIEHIEGVNILMATHSPFILSDLPDSNVLALSKESLPMNDTDIGKTFCANIHEMLGNSFFMEYSMGQLAQESVEEIFRKYNEPPNAETGVSEEEWARYEYVAKTVGDEYLRNTIKKVMGKLYERKERRTTK